MSKYDPSQMLRIPVNMIKVDAFGHSCRDIQIVDITTATAIAEDLSTATFSVDVVFAVEAGEEANVQCVVTLLESLGTETVAEAFACNSQLEVSRPQLWWPYLMSETPGAYVLLLVLVVQSAPFWWSFIMSDKKGHLGVAKGPWALHYLNG